MNEVIIKIPKATFIGSSDETEKLYQLEQKINKLILEHANELKRLGFGIDYWNELIPQSLIDILNNWQREYPIAAAVGYLRQYSKSIEP